MLRQALRATGSVVSVITLAGLVLTGACVGTMAGSSSSEQDRAADDVALAGIPVLPYRDACDRNVAAPGEASCFAKVRMQADGSPFATSASPAGLGATDLASAYNVPSSAASGGLVVAIVDANDEPTAESDLAVYRQQYGLPACTTANGCFRKVNETGAASPLPAADPNGWGLEIALDLDMASAACPDCKILLVEANSAYFSDLGAAVNTAASMGAAAISNSYGAGEFSGQGTFDTAYYDHPGVLVTASSGDSGYGAAYPAASPFVLSVGGTTLVKSTSSRGWAEAAWSGGGSGCSAYAAKPAWQTDSLCARRVEADVSAVADPNTGVAIVAGGRWMTIGGTSAASPFVAALFTRLGLAASSAAACKVAGCKPYPYTHASAFYDVTSGSNGSCSGSLLCTAGPGYDAPTGLGTPNATALVAAPSDAGVDGSAKDSGPALDAGTTDAQGGGAPKDAAAPSGFELTVVSPSVSATQGSSVGASLKVTTTGGFAKSIALAVTGLPTGVTSSFSPSVLTGAGSSTLTLSVSSAVPAGHYALNVTGTSGANTSAAALALVVSVPPSFSLAAAPTSLSVAKGAKGSFVASITPSGGFSSAVTVSAKGPAGLTFASPVVNATAVTFGFTVATLAAGTYPLTVTATGGGLTKTATVTLTVPLPPAFTLSVSPASVTLTPGVAGSPTVTVAGNSTFDSPVTIGVSGLPTGVTLAPLAFKAPGSGQASMAFSVGPKVAAGTYKLTLTATAGDSSVAPQSVPLNLLVAAPGRTSLR